MLKFNFITLSQWHTYVRYMPKGSCRHGQWKAGGDKSTIKYCNTKDSVKNYDIICVLHWKVGVRDPSDRSLRYLSKWMSHVFFLSCKGWWCGTTYNSIHTANCIQEEQVAIQPIKVVILDTPGTDSASYQGYHNKKTNRIQEEQVATQLVKVVILDTPGTDSASYQGYHDKKTNHNLAKVYTCKVMQVGYRI